MLVLLVLMHAALCSAAATIVAHAKGRPDQVNNAAMLGFMFGPIGIFAAVSLATADDLRERRERQAPR